jgi:hypothetical protein
VVRGLADVTWGAGEEPSERERARTRAARGPRAEPRPLGSLRSDAVLGALREQARFSAGALEDYAACPVNWLVRRNLRPGALDPDAEPLVRGQLAHQALAATLAGLRAETGSARVEPASLPVAERLLGDAIEELRHDLPISADATRARAAVRSLEVDLRRYLAFEAAHPDRHEPEHFELGFGFVEDEDGLGPLELGEGSVRLRGYVDRVDVDRGRGTAIVRDYKARSRAEFPVAQWRDKQRLQVALYLLAVKRLLGLDPVAGVYQPLHASGEKLRPRGIVLETEESTEQTGTTWVGPDVLPREEFDAALEAAEALAVQLADELRAGRLEPSPATCTPSGGCAYPGICRCEP